MDQGCLSSRVQVEKEVPVNRTGGCEPHPQVHQPLILQTEGFRHLGGVVFRTRMQTQHRSLCAAEVSETFVCIVRDAQGGSASD